MARTGQGCEGGVPGDDEGVETHGTLGPPRVQIIHQHLQLPARLVYIS
jgi:hypothetical protein